MLVFIGLAGMVYEFMGALGLALVALLSLCCMCVCVFSSSSVSLTLLGAAVAYAWRWYCGDLRCSGSWLSRLPWPAGGLEKGVCLRHLAFLLQ